VVNATTAAFRDDERYYEIRMDIFATVQTAVLWSRVTPYETITPVGQSDFEFVVPGGTKTYVDLDIHTSVHGRLVAHDGYSLDAADRTIVVNHFLHYLLSTQRHSQRRLRLVFDSSVQL
jgi:hypothetical protein